ncbi:MAG: hypothetical protein Q4G02_03300 [bacterium]|nr:hypothetical protein [bacterium]
MRMKKMSSTSSTNKKCASTATNENNKQVKTATYKRLARVISQDAFTKFGSSFDKLARFDR